VQPDALAFFASIPSCPAPLCCSRCGEPIGLDDQSLVVNFGRFPVSYCHDCSCSLPEGWLWRALQHGREVRL
jgi:hypothetical protein